MDLLGGEVWIQWYLHVRIPSGVIKHGNEKTIKKTPMNEGFIKKITDQWSIFHGYVSLPNGNGNINGI